MVWEDPIVAEVRRAREDLFREAGCDLRRLFEMLREIERGQGNVQGADPDSVPTAPASPSGCPHSS